MKKICFDLFCTYVLLRRVQVGFRLPPQSETIPKGDRRAQLCGCGARVLRALQQVGSANHMHLKHGGTGTSCDTSGLGLGLVLCHLTGSLLRDTGVPQVKSSVPGSGWSHVTISQSCQPPRRAPSMWVSMGPWDFLSRAEQACLSLRQKYHSLRQAASGKQTGLEREASIESS